MDKKETAITTTQHNDIHPHRDSNPIGVMMQTILSGEMTAEKVAAMKELVGVYSQMEDRNAEREFAMAKAAMQSELPKVVAERIIPDNNGNIRSTFAAFEDIMDAVGPCLSKHGFSVSFDIDVLDDGKRIQATCMLMHSGGHCKTNKFAVRIGSGPPKSSEAQADGAARSYARRGALCDALNIVIDRDSDARSEGGFITKEQADSLRSRLRAVKGDEAGFLKFVGADSFDEIRTGKFGAADAAIARKEAQHRTERPIPDSIIEGLLDDDRPSTRKGSK